MALLPDVAGRACSDLGCVSGQLATIWRAWRRRVWRPRHLRAMLGWPGRAEPSAPDLRPRASSGHLRARALRPVVSSMAIHYVADYRGLVRRIADWLGPAASWSTRPSTRHTCTRACRGRIRDAAVTRLQWAVDAYADEGLREEPLVQGGRAEVPSHAGVAAQRGDRRGTLGRAVCSSRSRRGAARAAAGLGDEGGAPLPARARPEP